ncbi:MAG: hypothetical protein IAE87_18510 [Rhodobacteraceae bacterium]|nr:hypothetical protein [Paracoccaceae bacterium]
MPVITGDSGNNELLGTTGNDTLYGQGGNDFLFGNAGDDQLFGGDGVDALSGAAGNDRIDGGAGTDRVTYFLETGTRGVMIDLGAGTATDTFGTTDTLIGIERVYGSERADQLTGSGGASELLFGRAGDDLIRGLGGNDTLVGDAGADTLDGSTGADQVAYFLETGTRGVTVDLLAGTATDTFGTADRLIGIVDVHGSNGNDTILGSSGGAIMDTLNGRDGDDYIDGRDGNDLIYTGEGDDHVVIGATLRDARDTVVINGHGNKLITGTGALGTPYGHQIVFSLDEGVVVNLATGIARSANMTLDFTAALHFLELVGTAQSDHLIGGNPAHDYLEWLTGNQGNDTLDGGSGTGNTVIYDGETRNGAFNHATQQQEYGTRGAVVNLATGIATDTYGFTDTLINIDSVRATEFVDLLVGNDQVNGFWGLEGADTLNGAGGSDMAHYREDSMTGGLRGVLVDLGQGYAIDGFGSRDTLISIEEVYATDFNDRMIGDGANNRLFSYDGDDNLTGGFGNDTLDGGGGNDTLLGGGNDDEIWGGAGNDTIDGGAGNDMVRYFGAQRGILADLAGGTIQDGSGGTDILTGIEGITGSEHADTLRGATGNDRLWGEAGDDRITGAAGNDTLLGDGGNDMLDGGAGNDEIWGEAGDDTLEGGAGDDLVRYRLAGAAVAVDLQRGTGSDGEGGIDRLSGVENLDGSDFGDALTGDGQGNRLFGYDGADTLDGGAGNDILLGGRGDDSLLGGAGNDEIWGEAGNDMLAGGAGDDLVRYRTSTTGVTVDLAAGTAVDGMGGIDRLFGIEHVDGSDQGDVLAGNDQDNRLFAHRGDDQISGGEGNDILLGGEGADSIAGGAGNDEIWGEAGNDTLEGGAGDDLLRYRTSTTGVTVDLANGTAHDGLGGLDLLDGIENVHGSDLADILTGSSGSNTLIGYDGADTLSGGTGQDVLSGGLGGDTYHYHAGDAYDVITDLGAAAGGADRVIVHDYLAEQASVYLSTSGPSTLVLDFGVARDILILANARDGRGAGAIEYVEFADGTVWDHATLISRIGQVGIRGGGRPTEAADTLFGTPGEDSLSGNGGDDVIHGVAGNDTLSGDAGQDTIRAGDGDDLVYGGAGNDTIFLGAGRDRVFGGAGSDTAVFDRSFRSIGGDFSVDGQGLATVAGNRLDGIEIFRFTDTELTAAELLALARNAPPVSILPDRLESDEGMVRLDLAAYFTDADGDALTFETADLPAGLTLTGSVIAGRMDATGAPARFTVIVSDGTHVLRETVDWFFRNVNAAPTGSLTIEGAATTGSELHARSTVADADGIDLTTLAYAWLRDGVAIAGATGASYTPVSTDVGTQISVRISYTDLSGTAERVTSTATGPVVATSLVQSGTSGDDTLRGDAGNDTLQGLDGADLLEGKGGSDRLLGGDGTDTLIGGAEDDFLFGGATEADLRDVIYGGTGNDTIDGGHGNDELRGDDGDDVIDGWFGADLIIGGIGNDTLSGAALGDNIHGGAGADFINGGFGHDRMNGGTGADNFYHLGIFSHGSDWVQDYSAAEGDRLLYGQAGALRSQFQVNFAETPRAGQAGVQEAFVIYRPTGQILWALIDGGAQAQINIVLEGQVFDLLA